MRYIFKAAILAGVLALLVPSVVFAGDIISDAAQALQHARVYIAPGTEKTDSGTAATLESKLKSDDNIVLVMLPSTAEAELGVDISTIASRLSDALGNQRILGLAVGNKVVGYAPYLPPDVATDQMRRANSVSNDPITALSTFVQNMHIWQRDHPVPTPTPPPSPKSSDKGEDSPSALIWSLVLIGSAVFIGIGITALISRSAAEDETQRTRFKAPDQVKDLLAKIAREREQVHDVELKQALYDMCLDIEKYFKSSSNDKERDSRFFNERLTDVTKVLEKYIDVQENQRYYNNPSAEMLKGKGSLIDFGVYVLEAIRRGNAADLFDYTVNTKILQAQKYR